MSPQIRHRGCTAPHIVSLRPLRTDLVRIVRLVRTFLQNSFEPANGSLTATAIATPPIWDNHLKGSTLPRPQFAGSPTKTHMLNELEFAYTPVRDKVRDLREYL
jgi:hypothetical protein